MTAIYQTNTQNKLHKLPSRSTDFNKKKRICCFEVKFDRIQVRKPSKSFNFLPKCDFHSIALSIEWC